jgi:hypothetical protein
MEILNSQGWRNKEGEIVQLFTCELDNEMIRISNSEEDLRILAQSLGINPEGYLTGDISDDIEACMHNDFCLHQKHDGVQSASDRVTIVEYLDGSLGLFSIVRKFGPARNDYAFPGGFNDLKKDFESGNYTQEDHHTAAMREGDEEVGGMEVFDNQDYFTRTIYELPVIHSKWWDPRAKFYCHGTSNGGLLEYIRVIRPLTEL